MAIIHFGCGTMIPTKAKTVGDDGKRQRGMTSGRAVRVRTGVQFDDIVSYL